MKIWLAIRRPIGYLIAFGLFTLALIAIHAIPVLLTNALLGIDR